VRRGEPPRATGVTSQFRGWDNRHHALSGAARPVQEQCSTSHPRVCRFDGALRTPDGHNSEEAKSIQELVPRGLPDGGRVVGMHLAALEGLWAAWDECTCAGAALLATFLSKLRVIQNATLNKPTSDLQSYHKYRLTPVDYKAPFCALGSPFRSQKPFFKIGRYNGLYSCLGPVPISFWSVISLR
jgi:hypothetical protein